MAAKSRSIGNRCMSSSSTSGFGSGSSSARWTPQIASKPFETEKDDEEEDDDRTLVMSARSTTTEARFGMMGEEEGDISLEEEGLLEKESATALWRKGEEMQAERLAEVDLGDKGDNAAFEGTWTIQEEKAVVKKMDRRVVLFVALLYLLSFLDRSNIGNARIAGLEVDLQLREGQYEWLLSGFYITYIAFEWMALL